MRVLWLTNTPVGASEYLKIAHPSGGWMSSLETFIKEINDVHLGVCFFFDDLTASKFEFNSVSYYPIKSKKSLLPKKISTKLFNVLTDTNKSALLKAIEDFKPDIIQLFGTESGLGEILKEIEIPVIVHIQGVMNAYLASWFPKNISQSRLFFNSSLKNVLLKKGILGDYYLVKKIARREECIIKNTKYFFGRTEWDRKLIKIYNKNAKYYHCEELLRPAFFEKRWVPKSITTLHLITTINPNIYKGLDVILETAFILKKKAGINFEWSIIGIYENNQLKRLMEKIKKMKYSENNVHFKGYKSTNELIDCLLNSDIFIHPSHIDNSPNSICEAMLLGMPVIAAHVGGIPSLIEHNYNGILYNSQDPFELAATIIDYSNNYSELQRLGDNAWKTANKRHSATTIVNSIMETYRTIISDD